MLPFVIAAILWLPQIPVAVISGLFFLLAAWEWTQFLSQCKVKRFLALACIGLTPFLMMQFDLKVILMLSFCWWVIGLLAVVFYPNGKTLWKSPLVSLFIGCWVIGPAWLAFMWLHTTIENGPQWLLFVLSLVWLADTAAYFSGRKWGKTPLAKAVSPKKTWQGFWGAIIATMIMSALLVFLVEVPFNAGWFIGLCLTTVLFSIVGDLTESLFKRVHEVKDSGSILPGHGGILDRVDSLTSAIPLFALGCMIL